tara:strand:- start:17653 stop:17883 length:231 start_codon:yes stop_codon:yes gene_type:complete
LVPKGFAHGFLFLSKVVSVNYKVDNYYNKKSKRSIIWNIYNLRIKWPIKEHPTTSKMMKVIQFLKNAKFLNNTDAF